VEYPGASSERIQVCFFSAPAYLEESCSNNVFLARQFGFVPFAVLDTSSTGRQTREGSRTLEVRISTMAATQTLSEPQYAFEDFSIRQVAQLLEKTDDETRYTNRSLVRHLPLFPSYSNIY
jgi:hypothetical protein